MAERVYRKKSTADVPSASIPDVTATVPKVEMPQQSVVASASTAGTGQRIFKKKAATSTPQGLTAQPAPRVYSVRPEVKAARVENLRAWFDEADGLVRSTQDYIAANRDTYNREYGSEYQPQVDQLIKRADEVEAYLDYYQGDAEAHRSLTSAFGEIKQYLRDFGDHTASVRDYYGNWDDEAAYHETVSAEKRREELLATDREALAAEMRFTQELIDLIDEYRYWENQDPQHYYAAGEHGAAEVNSQRYALQQRMIYYGISPDDKNDLEEKLKAAKTTDEEAEIAQEEARILGYAVEAKADPDYERYLLAGQNADNPTAEETYPRLYLLGWQPNGEAEKPKNPVTFHLENEQALKASAVAGGVPDFYDEFIFQMTGEQVDNYNYIFGKYGREEADKYLELLRSDRKVTRSTEFFEKYLENKWYEGVYSVVQGLDQFGTGLQAAFGNDSTKKRTLDPQLVGALVREDIGEGAPEFLFGSSLGQMAYDFGTTIANMLPSIGAGALANVVAPGAAAYVTPTLMGLSSGGNAYKDALNRGYTEEQSRTYGVLIGSSEALLSKALGSMGSVGKSFAGTALKNATDGIKNAALRFAVQMGGQMLSEAAEEGLQEILTPFFENIALDADNTWEDIDWKQAGYSAVMGALSSFAMDGGGSLASVAVVKAKQNALYRSVGAKFINAEGGVTIDDAIAIGLSNAKGTDAYKAAVKIQEKVKAGETVTPYAVGRMVAESQTEQAQTARAIEQEVQESGRRVGYDVEAVEQISQAAVALNLRVRFAAPNEMVNANNAGEYHSDTDTVVLNSAVKNVEKLMGYVMGHETAHSVEGTQQMETLKKLAIRIMGADAWAELQAKIQKDYAAAGATLSPAQVEKEALADWIGENLFKKGFVQAVVSGDARGGYRRVQSANGSSRPSRTTEPFSRNLGTELGGTFLYLLDRVRRVFVTKNSLSNNVAMLERLFMQAIEARDTRTVTDGEGVQGAIVALEDGKIYVQADRKVLTGTDREAWKGQIDAFFDQVLLRNGSLTVESVEGDELTITKDQTVWKGKDEHVLENGTRRPLRDNEYLVKLTALSHIDELAEASVVQRNKEGKPKTTPDAKNHPFAKDGFEYRTVYFQDFDGKYYRITLSIGLNDGVATVYNVGQVKEAVTPEGSIISAIGSKAQGVTAITTTVAQNDSGVNTQSMQEGGEVSTENDGNIRYKDVFGFRIREDADVDEDVLSELRSYHPTAQVDEHGNVTVYHRTSRESAERIRRERKMYAREDSVFFSTKAEGYASGYGDEVVTFSIPSTDLLINDVFDGEVHFNVPAKRVGGRWVLDVSTYLPFTADTPPGNVGTAQAALLTPDMLEDTRAATEMDMPAGEGEADTAPTTPQAPAVAAQVDEAAVLDDAIRSAAQGKVTSQATDVEGVIADLGDEEAVRRMYTAAQMHRPTGMVEVDGRRVDAGAYMDAYERSLPDDVAALEATVRELSERRTAEIVRMEQEGTLEDYRFGGLKIDLQLFAAQRKWDLLQLDAGEDGKKARQFYEKRLRGTDANHNQELVDLLAGRSETYNPISDEVTLDRAKGRLRDHKYQEKLIRRIGKYDPHDVLTAVDVAAAQVLINDAINEGELEVAADLIAGLSRKGTELGRAVQAFSMMARLTPEGTLRAAIRTVKADTDYVVGEGANEGLDVLADDLVRAIREAEEEGLSSDEIADRIREGEGRAAPAFEEDADFSSQIDNWENLNPTSYITVGNVTGGSPLHQVGLPAGKLYFDVSKLRSSLADHADHLSPDILKQIPKLLKNPIAIVEYRPGKGTNTVNVYGELYHNGTPITVGVVATLSPGKTVISKIRTIHARRDFAKQITDASILYLNENKNETDRWFQTQGQPVPMSGTKYGLIRSIANIGGSVNSGDTSSTASGPPSPQGEGVGKVKMTREELVEALTDDLAATEGTYLTRDDVAALVEKTIKEATNIPEQLKRYVLKKLRKDDGGLAQRIYEAYKKGHLNNAALRRAMEAALELPTLTDNDIEWVVKQGEKIESLKDKPVEQADAMDELYDFLGAKLSVNGLDRLQAWRKFGMLFNVKTHFRNILSNGAYYGIRKADDAVAMLLERILVRDPSRRSATLGWSHTEHGQSIMPLLQEQAELAVLEMQKRGTKYETGTGQLKQRRKFFGLSKFGEILNSANRWNSEWLEREDIWFFRPAYIDALGQIMTARGATEVTPELHQLAMQRALEATFRADNMISDVISALKRFQNESTTGKRLFGHAADVVIPFHKTPANLAAQAVWHSPIGIVKGAFDLYNATRGKGSKDVATAINTMAKGVTGSVLLAIGMLLGSAGLFNTGFGKTEKERAADEMAGLQDGAFVVGGVSVSLDWLQPAASPLIVGASIAERLKSEGLTLNSIAGAVMDGTDSLFELTMLQSLYDILGGYDAGASGTMMSVGENVVSQSVPTLVGQLARAIDPVQRKTKGDTEFETIINQVVAKIPGLTYLLDPELDVWGNVVYRTGKPSAGTAVLNAGQQFIIPANTKVGTGFGDPISQEILRLYEVEGGAVIPSAASRDDAKEAGVDYVDVNRLLGGVNRLAVEEFIGNEKPYDVMVETGELTAAGNPKTKKVTKYYRDMTDAERRKVLARIYEGSKEMVLEPDEGGGNESEQYFRDLIRRVRGGERGTFTAEEEQPAAKQESTSYFDDLIRRMNNGN